MGIRITDPQQKDSVLFDTLWSGKPERLSPHKIANQFYCEQKVEMRRVHGRIVTEEMAKGNETHEQAAVEKEDLTREELWERVGSGDLHTFLEEFFVTKIEEFLLVGKLDAVQFYDGKPQLVFDRKTTWHPDKLYTNQRIQTWLYGFLFDHLGLDTSNLQIAVLRHTHDIHPELAVTLQRRVLDEYAKFGEGVHEILPGATVHIFDYELEDHLDDLHWALEYWRGERNPIPTGKEGKCRSCEYQEKCGESLV